MIRYVRFVDAENGRKKVNAIGFNYSLKDFKCNYEFVAFCQCVLLYIKI